MPSSISSSRPIQLGSANPAPRRGLTRATWALFASMALLWGCAEAVSVVGLEHISKIHGRILREGRAAEQVRGAPRGQPETVIFVANSLFLEGVDFPKLRTQTSGKLDASRYIVEGTAYYDWYYGLRRLFRSGMRPDAVVLCLNPPHLLSDSIRGDFSARFLFDAVDIWPVSRDTRANLSATSGLYLAHFSNFYATRNVLRSVFTGKVAPAVGVMWSTSIFSDAIARPDSEAIPVMRERLVALKRLCEDNGARFSFLIPPTRQLGDTAIVAAGKQAGVLVMRPVPNYSLGTEYYQDGFHLNTRGAELFTRMLVPALLDPTFQ